MENAHMRDVKIKIKQCAMYNTNDNFQSNSLINSSSPRFIFYGGKPDDWTHGTPGPERRRWRGEKAILILC